MVQVDGVNMEVRVCFSMAAILPSVRLYFLINFHTFIFLPAYEKWNDRGQGATDNTELQSRCECRCGNTEIKAKY